MSGDSEREVKMSNWRQLLSRERLRPSGAPSPGDEDNDFLSDYYRVVFASSFRRLQDKTQVSPLAETDYVRRRLTHSVEVAAVGERMGRVVARRLAQRLDLQDARDDVGKVVATACLLHDIGNPPFGHEGELAIRKWADRSAPGAADLQCFDGNAHGFRIAVRLQHLGEPFGLNLTAATLAAMLKYPVCPRTLDNSATPLGDRGKSSVFSTEREHYENVATLVGLPFGARHPLSFLVEAADDIVNRLVDIEDALKLKLVSYEEVCDTLSRVQSQVAADLLQILMSRLTINNVGSEAERKLWAYQYFRVRATAELSRACEQVFVDNVDELEAGTFQSTDLVTSSAHADLYKAIKKLEYSKIFSDPSIVRIEAGGKRAIAWLLDFFHDEVRDSTKLALTVSTPLSIDNESQDPFLSQRRVVDYVAGMTDRYAMDLYQELSGVSI